MNTGPYTISSDRCSFDIQVVDALEWMRGTYPAHYSEIRREFAEPIIWSGAWLDTEAMGVDAEWPHWLADALESTELVTWEDGEPWAIPAEG